MGNFHNNYEYFAQKKITECKNEPKKSNNKSLLIQGKKIPTIMHCKTVRNCQFIYVCSMAHTTCVFVCTGVQYSTFNA